MNSLRKVRKSNSSKIKEHIIGVYIYILFLVKFECVYNNQIYDQIMNKLIISLSVVIINTMYTIVAQ